MRLDERQMASDKPPVVLPTRIDDADMRRRFGDAAGKICGAAHRVHGSRCGDALPAAAANPNGLDKALSRNAGCWRMGMGIRIISRLIRPVPVVYVTRFNIAVAFTKTPRKPMHLDPSWLDERIALFERHCVPKMATVGRALHLADPHQRRNRRRNCESSFAGAQRRAAPHCPGRCAWACYRGARGSDGKLDHHCGLDSDDQLSARYTQALREIDWNGRRRFAAYFTKGLYLDATSGAYRAVRMPLNQFPAVFERRQARDFVTVHAHRHNELYRLMDAIQIWTTRPMWCTVVHGGNVPNRMHGKPVPAPPENW
jgi:hypothetical protein